MRRRLGVLIACVVVSFGLLLAAACGDDEPLQVPVNFDAANNGDADASQQDSSVVVPDTGSDTSVVDTGIDATPAKKCDGGAVFCDDFDDGTLAQWSTSLTDPADGGTTIGVTTDDVRSPPNAVLATIRDPANKIGHAAELAAFFPTVAGKTTAVLDFDVKIESGGPSPQALSVAELTGSRRLVLLASGALAITASDGGSELISYPLAQMLPTSWFHARIVMAQATGHAQVFVNGALSVDVETPPLALGTGAAIYVGVHGPPGSARYDNVVFDWQ